MAAGPTLFALALAAHEQLSAEPDREARVRIARELARNAREALESVPDGEPGASARSVFAAIFAALRDTPRSA